ncbi:M48 family metallopeptidase [Polyangium aurulentum]|uniref:M48 family metallopeptidase n=1 Tax=Polyangium aurulentum TaxID=2567896 RepID=UPI0010AED606|nr:M48 family metallopeptidase [Polyangium aurulentum]UQA61329.1 M48 family metallopeptidase [Polyangium aurulentum]
MSTFALDTTETTDTDDAQNGAKDALPDLYPPCPSDAPPAETSSAYKARVVLVLASLLLFVVFYVGLLFAAGYLVYLTLFEMSWFRSKAMVLNIGAIAGAVMLFLFLLKGLFHRRGFSSEGLIEVTEAEQPKLFAFLRQLCRDAGSPMPGKVYLSHEVNAAVSYPSSLLSLVWPIRKNLVIGLGLVAALDLSELKAVLAHEFGHFSQSSMKLGQYVYIANGVVGDMVFGRDAWDRALNTWKGADIRLSFPAWILSGVVWGLRKLLELAFRGIYLAKLALGRQMEFNADLYAVRLAGSDAIVSGLWKAERAALAYRDAIGGLASVAEHGKFSEDVFDHVERSMSRLDTHLGKNPEVKERFAPLLAKYERGPRLHFTTPMEKVSALWESHPANHEREANAKRTYVAAVSDERPAWSLFVKRKGLRKRLSRMAYEAVGLRPTTILPAAKIAELIEEESGEMHQPDHYHGLYESRIVNPGDIDKLSAELDEQIASGTIDRAALREKAAAFTGKALAKKMAKLMELQDQMSLIEALQDGAKLKSKTVPFRGSDRTRNEILDCAREVAPELKAARERVKKADPAFFRYYYALSADIPAAREELWQRYTFLRDVQGLIMLLMRSERPLEAVVDKLRSNVELSSHDVVQMREILSEARESLVEVVRKSVEIAPPKLALLDSETRLDRFILPETIVDPLEPEVITGPWIGTCVTQFNKALRRLRKLHFKNLGALLALGERLDPTLFPKAEPPPADPEP